jgi:Ser-tRNA(Ala) deacylase AlaX
MVDWAQGCGYRGEISPFKGNGKMPWKVEWAAKWPTVGVVCETAGKDHFTKGGSRTVSVAISCEVFKFPPPYPSTCKEIGKGYEFFLVGGKKMSTSKGLGVSFVEVSDIVPPEMLRFLMVKARPEMTIEFTSEGNTIPFLFNEFDRIERIYFGLEKVDERDKTNAKRVYELSVLGKIPKQNPFRISFDFASMLAQALPKEDRLERSIQILKRTGHLDRKLTEFERDELKKRLDYAESWAKDLAPENMRVTLLKELPEDLVKKLSDKQKSALKDLSQFLKTDRKDTEIWSRIREVANKEDIDSKKVFQAAYLVLLGRPYGPRLIPFIQSLDRSFIKKRLGLKDVVKVVPKKEIVEEVVEVKKPVKKEIRVITRPLFWKDAYMREFDATVTEIVGNRLALDQTCFYGESGGQAGDTGEIEGIEVIDSKKEGGRIVHILGTESPFKVGDKVHGKIFWDRRYRIMKLHAASHIMEFFLFKTFGKKKRIGSFVNDKKDRSDYQVETKITSEEIKKVEDLCNEFISRNLEIKRWEDPERSGFWIWESGEIKEYCGGTHVKNTKEIGKIKLKIKNLGTGKQRIETYLVE